MRYWSEEVLRLPTSMLIFILLWGKRLFNLNESLKIGCIFNQSIFPKEATGSWTVLIIASMVSFVLNFNALEPLSQTANTKVLLVNGGSSGRFTVQGIRSTIQTENFHVD